MVFLCKAITIQINKDFDILDINYFNNTDLPELSEDRILKSQIEMLYKKVIESDWRTYFD